jgi:pyruvate formate lyase activating enzyme
MATTMQQTDVLGQPDSFQVTDSMHTLKDLPIKGFIDTSFVDWPGKICAVLFFPRCNFRCPYCHNSELVLRPDSIETIEPESVFARLNDLRGWIDGVCVTGGEPTLLPKLRRLLEIVREAGFQTKLDTNGSNPEVLRELIDADLLDYVAMDVKSCLDEDSYCKITNVADSMLSRVRTSIDLLIEGRVDYEFRVTIVPEYHEPEDIYQLARDLSGAARLRLQNFKPGASLLDPTLKTAKPFTPQDMESLQLRVDELLCVPGKPAPPTTAAWQ